MSDKKKNINDATKEELIVIVKQLHTKLNAMQHASSPPPSSPPSSSVANHQQLREYEARVASLTEQSRLLKLELNAAVKERSSMASQVQKLQEKSQADEETIRALIQQVEDGSNAVGKAIASSSSTPPPPPAAAAHDHHQRRTSVDATAVGATRSVSPSSAGSTAPPPQAHARGGGGNSASRVEELVLTVRGLEEALSEAQEKISDLTTYNEYWEKQEEARRRRGDTQEAEGLAPTATTNQDAATAASPEQPGPQQLQGVETSHTAADDNATSEREAQLSEECRRLRQDLRQLRVDAQLQAKATERYQTEAQELLSLCAALQRLVGAQRATTCANGGGNGAGSFFLSEHSDTAPPLATSTSMAALPAVASAAQLTDHSANNNEASYRTPSGGGAAGSHHSDAGSSSVVLQQRSKPQAATLFHSSRPSPPHSVSGAGDNSSADHHHHHGHNNSIGSRLFSQRIEGGSGSAADVASNDAHMRSLGMASAGMAFIASLPAVQLRGATPREKKLMERMKLLEDHIKAADTFEATRKRNADEVEENRAEIMAAMRQQIATLRAELAHAKKSEVPAVVSRQHPSAAVEATTATIATADGALTTPLPQQDIRPLASREQSPPSPHVVDAQVAHCHAAAVAPAAACTTHTGTQSLMDVPPLTGEAEVPPSAVSTQCALLSPSEVTRGRQADEGPEMVEAIVQTDARQTDDGNDAVMRERSVGTDLQMATLLHFPSATTTACATTSTTDLTAIEEGVDDQQRREEVSSDNFDVEELNAAPVECDESLHGRKGSDGAVPQQRGDSYWAQRVAELEGEIETLQAALDRHAQATAERERRFRDAVQAIQAVKQRAADATHRVAELDGVRTSLQHELDAARSALKQLHETTQLTHEHDVAVAAKYKLAWESAHAWGSTMADGMVLLSRSSVSSAQKTTDNAAAGGSAAVVDGASLKADVAWLETHWLRKGEQGQGRQAAPPTVHRDDDVVGHRGDGQHQQAPSAQTHVDGVAALHSETAVIPSSSKSSPAPPLTAAHDMLDFFSFTGQAAPTPPPPSSSRLSHSSADAAASPGPVATHQGASHHHHQRYVPDSSGSASAVVEFDPFA